MQNAEEASLVNEIVSSLEQLNVGQHAPRQQSPAKKPSELLLPVVLLLGEGNATFALSPSLEKVLKKYADIHGYKLLVTDNISSQTWNTFHQGAYKRLLEQGCDVKFGVDAATTDLVKGIALIIFNFPFAHAYNGYVNNGKQQTVQLIIDTMLNIVRKADCGTRVWIALATAKPDADKTQPYGEEVKHIIKKLLDECRSLKGCDQCLLYEDALDSLFKDVEGYQHMRTVDRRPYPYLWNHNEKKMYCFKVGKRSKADAGVLL